MVDTSTDSKWWIPTDKDNYPRPVIGGIDKDSGDTVYVGRGKSRGHIIPGKVYKAGAYGAGLYVADDGKEHYVKDYEMLICTKPTQWISEHDGGYPLKAIPGGADSDGNTLYVARAKHTDGEWVPGKLYPPHKRCVYSHNGKEHQNNNYEVLSE